MANWYCDPSGNDTTGTGTNLLPYLTINKCVAMASASDEIRCGKTAAYTNVAGANLTWTHSSTTVITSASLVGLIAVGDTIGRIAAAGNGALETFYRVIAVTAATITLETNYCGTTGTDTNSVMKVVPSSAFSAASGVALCTINKSLAVSGGWTLATETQDGETWIKHVGVKTTSPNYGFYTTVEGVTVSKINVTDCYGNIYPTAINCIFSNITALSPAYWNIYMLSATGITLQDCMFNGGGAAGYPALQIAAASSVVTCIGNVYAVSYRGNNPAVALAGINSIINNIKILASGSGVTTAAGGIVQNSSFKTCSSGCLLAGNNSSVINCTFESNIYGCYLGTATISCRIYNCTFTSMINTAIYLTQARGVEIDTCVFTGNLVDVYLDGYSSDVLSVNNTHTTPANWAYSRAIWSGITTIKGCTIDVPSVAKAYQIVTGASYTIPQYLLQNSFGGQYGAVYANGVVTRDTSVLSPGGYYTLYAKYTTTVAVSKAFLLVGAMYVKGSTAYTVGYKLRATGVWVGTLIPYLKLNGKIIKTGATISSISNGSWDTPTALSVTTGEVTEDGELTLEFVVNSNNIGIHVGDVVVS